MKHTYMGQYINFFLLSSFFSDACRRRKLKNCLWTKQATLDRMEYIKGCGRAAFLAKNYGDPLQYRTYSGVCNNLSTRRREHYGVFGLPFSRLLGAHFHGK